ncbi:MAG: hypothetical protein WAL38_01490 [Solirubrobacteraceae bacterium]
MTTTVRPRSAKNSVPLDAIPAAPTVERAFARGAAFAREERSLTLLVAYLGPLLDEIDDPVSRLEALGAAVAGAAVELGELSRELLDRSDRLGRRSNGKAPTA